MSLSFFQPTFTQGLIVGQLSILILLGTILKYLFLESSQDPFQSASYHQQVDNDAFARQRNLHARKNATQDDTPESESTEWFNTLLKQVIRTSDMVVSAC